MTYLEALVIAHFIGDWILQPHWMAIRKTSDPVIRGVHCMIVMSCFVPITPWYWLLWIYGTHFIIDSYKPLYWFRRLRGDFKDLESFRASFATPDGFFVNIVFDQLFHVLTLLPIVLIEKR
jgi:hypothetical protein